jgi:hypothetical protein
MKNIIFLLLIPVFGYSQKLKLSIDKVDEFTKDTVRATPFQIMASTGLLQRSYISMNARREGSKYYIGFQSQAYSQSKSLENTAIRKGVKVYFKLQNDSIVVASYESEDVQPIFIYDRTYGNWQYSLDFNFEISKTDILKLFTSPVMLIRLENGQDKADIPVVDRFRNTNPQTYFVNFVQLLK